MDGKGVEAQRLSFMRVTRTCIVITIIIDDIGYAPSSAPPYTIITIARPQSPDSCQNGFHKHPTPNSHNGHRCHRYREIKCISNSPKQKYIIKKLTPPARSRPRPRPQRRNHQRRRNANVPRPPNNNQQDHHPRDAQCTAPPPRLPPRHRCMARWKIRA